MPIYLIPTVIAPDTSSDVLPRQILEIISKTSYYFVENVRTTRRFISELKLGLIIDELHFFELDKDTPTRLIKKYFDQIPENENIGIISEAGCPGIADPGALAVGIAHQLGIRVIPLVGPSSIFMALMSSGFSGQHFTFNGYLPINKQERINKIKELENTVIKKGYTQIFMETPFRSNQILNDLIDHANPNTLLFVATEITNFNEMIITKSILEWRKTKIDLHKKPTIFILGI
jgi:16S rRNA (cytidine1402-2'-O)-methyltransferase